VRPVAVGANLAWGLANAPAYAAFLAALGDPQREQERILRRYVASNAETAFGRAHGFARITSIDDFRRRVPLRDYDDFAPYVERIAAGEHGVLSVGRVTRLARSSGSTRAAKLIPYTAGLQQEFNRAIGPWIVDLFLADPRLAGGSAYWSISPLAQSPDAQTAATSIHLSPGGISPSPCTPGEGWGEGTLLQARREDLHPNPLPEYREREQREHFAATAKPIAPVPPPIGFEEDSAYLGGVRKRLVDAVMAVPAAVRHCDDIDTFRYLTLLFLLARRDLRLISVWHPSFLQSLLEALPQHWENLLKDIARGTLTPPAPMNAKVRQALQRSLRPGTRRAAELAATGPANWPALWPSLRLISAWGSGHAHGAAAALAKQFPNVRSQPKGLLATEAFVTLPFQQKCPLALRSHFFEFLDDAGTMLLAHQLREGAEYELIVTTAGGLWRYRLGDRVRVSGRSGRTPCLQFVGRADCVVDQRGEKLSEGFVAGVLQQLLASLPSPPPFAMLVPQNDGIARYTLLIETAEVLPPDLPIRLDQGLGDNPHYAWCRNLGQLGTPRVLCIRQGAYPIYVAALAAAGRRIGDIKAAALSGDTSLAAKFRGTYL
jgi:hypothetical protein